MLRFKQRRVGESSRRGGYDRTLGGQHEYIIKTKKGESIRVPPSVPEARRIGRERKIFEKETGHNRRLGLEGSNPRIGRRWFASGERRKTEGVSPTGGERRKKERREIDNPHE